MAELIPTHAWSFLRGRNRDAEMALWTQYANVAEAIRGIALHNRVEVVIATALDLRAVEHITRPLPFGLHTPFNQLLWPQGIDPDLPIGAEAWPYDLLATLFGPQVAPFDQAGDGLVLIDAHLLPPNDRERIAQRLIDLPGLLMLPPGQAVPAELRAAVQHDRLEPIITSCPNPSTPTALEACLSEHRWQRLVVAGAGPRLLPGILGLCDILLFQRGTAHEQPYHERHQLCANAVALAAELTRFDHSMLPTAPTRSSGLRAYLESWLISTADRVQHDARFPMIGPLPGQGLRITPLLG